ncbi:2-amino-4-hydroxy-6-hydroxymethyldihydropteridine diphosphokinase [Alkalilimnicola ehrlichii MLHE-1]|uniref:2-amino-4-hydroxy-6-hydroxymethyldihydropteridine pyrophosphokinase n=1 Tax=Alkalilimnicola ehrlichii (strain ATCC BAA-1101 / DSM 17681 / MLHE-1) TaxID=187272 RepID=Q0AB70_ALKEH|nr:2-amino-4-hydroxy-6-hydroxymethyldihydropteridine pyrophosphokinase [Alkalilimnicola ehrlichii MLHE-1]
MSDWVTAYLGLGSNLNGPRAQIERAVAALARLPGCRGLRSSSLYRNPPMGPVDQPDFVNAVVALRTRLDPLVLLDQIQGLERQQGRVRGRYWGERTLDVDLLLYGDHRVAHARLTVPHPGLPHRAFVLYPLAELADAPPLPGLPALETLLAGCGGESLEKIAPPPLP